MGERAAEEVELVEQEVLGDDLLRGHVGDPDEGQDLVGAAGGEQGGGELQGVGGDDVVVGEPVDQEEGSGEPGGEGQEGAGVVGPGSGVRPNLPRGNRPGS